MATPLVVAVPKTAGGADMGRAVSGSGAGDGAVIAFAVWPVGFVGVALGDFRSAETSGVLVAGAAASANAREFGTSGVVDAGAALAIV